MSKEDGFHSLALCWCGHGYHDHYSNMKCVMCLQKNILNYLEVNKMKKELLKTGCKYDRYSGKRVCAYGDCKFISAGMEYWKEE